MPEKNESPTFMVTSEVARFLGMSAEQIRSLERAGKLSAMRTAGGIRLFHRSNIEEFSRHRAEKKIR